MDEGRATGELVFFNNLTFQRDPQGSLIRQVAILFAGDKGLKTVWVRADVCEFPDSTTPPVPVSGVFESVEPFDAVVNTGIGEGHPERVERILSDLRFG